MYFSPSCKPPNWPRIYLFGDSLTEWSFFEHDAGFGDRLTKYYDGRAEVVNRGQAGATTRHLAPIFPRSVLADAQTRSTVSPLLITIFLGANDACFLVPLTEFLWHLRSFVNQVLEHPSFRTTKILLMTPPPIDVTSPTPGPWEDEKEVEEEAREGRGHQTWLEKRKFAEGIAALAMEYMETEEERVWLLDAWKEITTARIGKGKEGFAELNKKGKLPGCGLPWAMQFGREWFRDGLHFGKKGYEVLGDCVFETLFETWPELRRENLKILEELS
ncbi:MAG: hypothetical protein Q9227_001520 [Pyrenula ochraceoflavens]